jgi:hypothetical protein
MAEVTLFQVLVAQLPVAQAFSPETWAFSPRPSSLIGEGAGTESPRRSRERLRHWLIVAYLSIVVWLPENLSAQPVSITLNKSVSALLHVDSANWNEAWIEVDGAPAGSEKLTTQDLFVGDGERTAQILSVDSIGSKFRSHLALSFMLDNSSSMFHTYDSLTRMCDSIIAVLPPGVVLQAVTFDNTARSESHIYTKRSSVFIAQSGFRDSAATISDFWHFFHTIRTEYTPLYDAIWTVIANIGDRRAQMLGSGVSGVGYRKNSFHIPDTLNPIPDSCDDVVLVITDGKDNASRASIEMLNDFVSTAHVRLFAIDFRTRPDARLLWLARHAGGEFYVADNISDLGELLRDIRTLLTRQYHVRYRFPSLTPSSGK